MANPIDIAHAIVNHGELLVVDGRGNTWKFEFGKKVEDAHGDDLPAPDDAQAAWAAGGWLHLIDGSQTCWTMDPTCAWTKGPKIEPLNPEDEGPWIAGPRFDNRITEEAEPRSKKKAA